MCVNVPCILHTYASKLIHIYPCIYTIIYTHSHENMGMHTHSQAMRLQISVSIPHILLCVPLTHSAYLSLTHARALYPQKSFSRHTSANTDTRTAALLAYSSIHAFPCADTVRRVNLMQLFVFRGNFVLGILVWLMGWWRCRW